MQQNGVHCKGLYFRYPQNSNAALRNYSFQNVPACYEKSLINAFALFLFLYSNIALRREEGDEGVLHRVSSLKQKLQCKRPPSPRLTVGLWWLVVTGKEGGFIG